MNRIFIHMGTTFVAIPRIKVFYASNSAVKTEPLLPGNNEKRVQNHFQKKSSILQLKLFQLKHFEATVNLGPVSQGSEFRSNVWLVEIVYPFLKFALYIYE